MRPLPKAVVDYTIVMLRNGISARATAKALGVSISSAIRIQQQQENEIQRYLDSTDNTVTPGSNPCSHPAPAPAPLHPLPRLVTILIIDNLSNLFQLLNMNTQQNLTQQA
ncbi:hypothetical protein BGZ51_001686, partial [Haplosporangium sp. Z 767]